MRYGVFLAIPLYHFRDTLSRVSGDSRDRGRSPILDKGIEYRQENEAYTTGKMKAYPDGSATLLVASEPVFGTGLEAHGDSTAIKLYGDYAKAVSYVVKYIGKEQEKIGGRWYYSGGKLGRPTVTYIDDCRMSDHQDREGAYSFDVPGVAVFCEVRL